MPLERLQKIISAAGIASRRAAEELITTGRVEVNGKMVTELGAKADVETDEIRVNGSVLHAAKQQMYLVMHKPKGYVTTVSDPEGRPTVMDLLPPDCPRVYPIGRLDYLTEGILLFTNDGELAYKLMHASSKVPKTYLVKVSGEPTEEDVDRLRHGVRIARRRDPKDGGGHVKTAPAQIEWVRHADNPWLQVTLIEGKNRQIRKMFEEIGHHIEKIRRIQYGPLELDLEPGALRSLKPQEVTELKIAAGLIKGIAPAATRAKKSARAESGPSEESGVAQGTEARDARKRPIFERKKPSRSEDSDKAERPARSSERAQRPGARGNYAFGVRKDSDDRRSSRGAGTGERRSYRPRTDGDERRPSRPAGDRGERSYFRPRRDDDSAPRTSDRGDRPFRPRTEGGERRPSRPVGERGDRPFRPRTESGDRRPSRPAGDRPFRPRAEGDRPPRQDRGDRPFRPRTEGADRRPSRPVGERGGRPFRPRRDDDRPPRREGSRDRPLRPRTEEGDRRPSRPAGDRPFRPRRDDDRPPR